MRRFSNFVVEFLKHEDGYKPRTEANHKLYLECFRLVLERCDPNVRHPRFGRTVLHDVAASDEAVSPEEAVAFATMLLDAGARVDERDDLLRSTPLGSVSRGRRLGGRPLHGPVIGADAPGP
jgi:hypothetical protein